jgi:thiol-disulfide isomerase/thioredoxin
MMPSTFRLLVLICLITAAPLAAAATEKATLDLSRYKGQTVYVDFWASWCIPCKKSFPWMEALHQKYHDKGLQIIAVNLDENASDADQFLQKFPVSFTIIRDPEGRLAQRFDIQGMPTALLFDASGTLISRHIGFRSDEKADYEAAIVDALPQQEKRP